MTIIDPSLALGADGAARRRAPQSGKEFTSNQEVRWCPGCGDYAILRRSRASCPTSV